MKVHYMTVHYLTVQYISSQSTSSHTVQYPLQLSVSPSLFVLLEFPVHSNYTRDHTGVCRVIWENYCGSGHWQGGSRLGNIQIFINKLWARALGLTLWSIKYKNVKLHKLSSSLQFSSKGAVNCCVYS